MKKQILLLLTMFVVCLALGSSRPAQAITTDCNQSCPTCNWGTACGYTSSFQFWEYCPKCASDPTLSPIANVFLCAAWAETPGDHPTCTILCTMGYEVDCATAEEGYI